MIRSHAERTKAAVLALGVLGLCLAPIGLQRETEFIQRLFDSLHVPLFAATTFALYRILRVARPAHSFNLAISAAIVAVAAILIETLQPFFGRSASLIDLRNGLFGVAVATGWAALPPDCAFSTKLLQAFSSIAVFLYTLHPAYNEYRVNAWRDAHLPLLADFEDEQELQLWRPTGGASIELSAERALTGAHSLLVQTRSGDWSGVGLRGGDSAWSRYGALEIGVFNDSAASFTLGVRIDDARPSPNFSERFNRGIPLASGWNRLRIPIAEIAAGPKEKRLDMDSIRRMVLFVAPEEPPRRLFIDGVKLVESLTP